MRAGAAGQVDQALQDVMCALGALAIKHRCKRIQPFLRFDIVCICSGHECVGLWCHEDLLSKFSFDLGILGTTGALGNKKFHLAVCDFII